MTELSTNCVDNFFNKTRERLTLDFLYKTKNVISTLRKTWEELEKLPTCISKETMEGIENFCSELETVLDNLCFEELEEIVALIALEECTKEAFLEKCETLSESRHEVGNNLNEVREGYKMLFYGKADIAEVLERAIGKLYKNSYWIS